MSDMPDRIARRMGAEFVQREPSTAEPSVEQTVELREILFAFLCRKYTQSADARQRAMGLQYMHAETSDLADEIAKFLAARASSSKIYSWVGGAITKALQSTDEVVEVLERVRPLFPITVNETADYAELTFGEHQTQAMTTDPGTWLALNDLYAKLKGQSE